MNILWMAIDTLRADHLGCYGYFRETSPTLDRLAQDGVLFRDFYASGVPTGPGFSSLISGRSVISHGFYMTPWNIPNAPGFDDEVTTIPEVVQDNSELTTAAFDNLISFRSHLEQFPRGFEFYINVTRRSLTMHHRVLAEEVNARLLPWLRQHSGEPFFLFVHYWDPHRPYNQPEPYRHCFRHAPGNWADLRVLRAPAGYDYVPGWGQVGQIWEGDEQGSIDLYDGEIRYLDEQIAVVLETLRDLDLLQQTLVVVTSDHGENLGQHGFQGHGSLHEEVVRVPLIMWRPGLLPQGKVVEGFAQHADLGPTLLRLLGINPEPGMDGTNMLPRIRGAAADPESIVIESLRGRTLRRGPWQYLARSDGPPELYHLQQDPMEVHNLVDQAPAQAQELQEELEAWLRSKLGERDDPLPIALETFLSLGGKITD